MQMGDSERVMTQLEQLNITHRGITDVAVRDRQLVLGEHRQRDLVHAQVDPDQVHSSTSTTNNTTTTTMISGIQPSSFMSLPSDRDRVAVGVHRPHVVDLIVVVVAEPPPG